MRLDRVKFDKRLTECGLDGDWGHVHTWLVLLVIAATVVAMLPIGSRSLRKSPVTTEQADAGAPVRVA